ncbi:MAG TPA: S8 family serine peptidase, partial [Thermoanaerobaculia bacterium]|nr:S8 family serine peptidase [Thermoanaerobaculia bacterium]
HLTLDSLWEIAQAAELHGLESVLRLPGGEEAAEEGAGEEEAPAATAAALGADGEAADERRTGVRRRKKNAPWRKDTRPGGEGRPGGYDDAVEDEIVPEPDGVLVSRPLVAIPGRDRKGTVWAIRKAEEEAVKSGFRPRHALALYWRVDCRPHSELVGEILARFNALAEVDLAYREVRAIDTSFHMGDVTGAALSEDQGYLDPAPVGIGAQWLKDQLGARQAHLTLIDLEQGWHVGERRDLQPGHEELGQLKGAGLPLLIFGENRDEDEPGAGNHGTAVLGQLAAAGASSLQVRGAVEGYAGFHLASHYRVRPRLTSQTERDNPFPGTNGHVAAAIVNCLVDQPSTANREIFQRPLTKGDVLLLEVQRGRLPTEIDEADLDAIRLATALGIVVVEAAGNGNFDLDRCVDPQTGRTLRRGAAGFVDSGAILVGASFSVLPHDRAPFSNYGSRVDCYGWGEGVTSCGYGDLAGDTAVNFYTNTFNGTSSAAPIIAAAAALLQCLHLERTGRPLLPFPMRGLLAGRATGTPQGPNVGGNIGVMPNLDAIARSVLQLVPDVYLRRSLCDDGGTLEAGEELSSSPDVVVAKSAAALGEGSGTVNDPAPGEQVKLGDTGSRQVFARLRNRGRSTGRKWVRLFVSPTATLVPPERWLDIGAVEVAGVPTGDTLAVTNGHPWTPPASFTPPTAWGSIFPKAPADYPDYGYLAVVEDEEAAKEWDAKRSPPSPLPPGGSYFSWPAWRAFLRRPGVAWRNSHRIPAGQSLGFLIAGTLDRERDFDLEVIQRLPQGTKVDWVLPDGLATKLAQRQPGLLFATPRTLTLPERRSTRFSRVRLPKGLCAPARFDVTGSGGIGAGHSLAIRQLWRGEEVGRITWHFGP